MYLKHEVHRFFIRCIFINPTNFYFTFMAYIESFMREYRDVFEEQLLKEILDNAVYQEVEAEEILIDFKQSISHMPLLLEGVIKVMREDEAGEEGAELLLYYIEKGTSCVFSLSCCVGHRKSEIRAIAEVDSKVLLLPSNKMEEWMATYSSWRNFVMNSYQDRLDELLETIDAVAFKSLNERLLDYLKEKARIAEADTIEITHLEIAQELYTSRVVISRLLKGLENKGIIQMQRNSIKVLDYSPSL